MSNPSDHPFLPVTCYIGLGSNLGDSRKHLETAICEIEELPQTHHIDCSPLFQTAPIGGPEDQSDYLNAVIAVETSLSPLELLDGLQQIEYRHHRVRTLRWGARTLDLDILLYGDISMETDRLKLPHPCIGERAFVLKPLLTLVPEDFEIPGQGRIKTLLPGVEDQEITPVGRLEPDC